jgi:DNA-binding MarR family transcriptional regulator
MRAQKHGRRTASPLASGSSRNEPDAPIVTAISSKLIVAANFLRRGAILRYRRLVGLPWVEFGIVAVLGRRKPITVNRLAELLGMDKAQLSRALSNLVKRKLVARHGNPADSREVLVALTTAGLRAHDTVVCASTKRNACLLGNLSPQEISQLDGLLDELTERAIEMLRDEQKRGDEILASDS